MSIRILPSITAPVVPDGWTPQSGRAYWLWSPRERQVLRERYIHEGPAACQALLPARCRRAIHEQARKMQLRQTKGYRRVPPSTPEIDLALRDYYAGKTKRGQLKVLAAKYDRPTFWLLARARALGIVVGRLKPTEWAPAEAAILRAHSDLSDTALQHKLRQAGYERTVGAIATRCYQLRLPRGADPDQWTAYELAGRLGCDSHRVVGWINRGLLKASRDGDVRTAPWRIQRKDLRRFLVTYPGDWDHRPVDHLFLVEILAGTVGGYQRLMEVA